MSDTLYRIICRKAEIRAVAVNAIDICEQARKYHNMSPLATAALGRSLCAASMLGAESKDNASSLTLQIRGNGPLGSILTVADNKGNVKGYLQNPSADLPLNARGKLDVSSGVGREGTITVIRDLNLKEPFVGTTKLVSGEIAEDVAAYLLQSEQVPSAVALGVLVDRDRSVKQAGGYIISVMPNVADEDLITLSEAVKAYGEFTPAMESGLTVTDLLFKLLDGFDPVVLETHPIAYRCDCSKERVERALISIGAKDLRELASGQKSIEVNCQFCDKKYVFSPDDVFSLIK